MAINDALRPNSHPGWRNFQVVLFCASIACMLLGVYVSSARQQQIKTKQQQWCKLLTLQPISLCRNA